MMRNQVERSSLKAALETRLPQYLDSIQANAKQYKLDWHLLTAIGYQESHLKSDAISPTGVTGLMMLTQATATEMGVADRTDPMQSIQGGAKYFGQLLKQYPKASTSDRVWFALVAYNMGPNALEQVRAKVKKKGQDPNVWADVYQLMSDQAVKNASYRQAVHYVTRIRAYLETIKQDRKLSRL
jgi:membrane-bound lytic murein transglycosylase MltF